ncbi:MAG: S8 family peptidase [Chitinophagaceae bacterium]|nr:S8 family peptidase [Chitinophagaceae bacterium]
MTIMRFPISTIIVIGIFSIQAIAQKNYTPAGWHLMDKATDGYHGISLEKAYQLVKNKKPVTVVVGVIDGGTDTTHEDLKEVLWRNIREIPGNGKDDDGNGYVDDVYGWNFLGNANGQNIGKENIEAIRLYHVMKDDFENKPIDPATLTNEQKEQYAIWKKIEEKLNVSAEDRMNFRLIQATAKSLEKQDSVLQEIIGKKEYTLEELEKTVPTTDLSKRAKFNFLRTAQLLEFEPDKTNVEIFEDLNGYLSMQEMLLTAKEKPLNNYRAIIGDNPTDINDRFYGNNDVMATDAKHGTHVAGIIAAVRNNGKGGDGVANNVKILTVRAVPDGDEYDKDVALSIRYAVDNGAKVINMSFGKEFSPNKPFVDAAIRYAAEKDVLLVHAAGNDSKNIDEGDNFPTAILGNNTRADNMITIGASGDSSIKSGMIAPFTNFGKSTVHLLAPGVKIYNTVPAGNRYTFLEGTSMAAPVVSGIAALIRGYYPELNATEVKRILMESSDRSLSKEKFDEPGSEKNKKIPMADLCASGGIANAYTALLLAEKVSSEKLKRAPLQK